MTSTRKRNTTSVLITEGCVHSDMDTQETPKYLIPAQVARILRVDAMTVRKRIISRMNKNN